MILCVATKGDDQWSGRLPEPNAAGTDGPLATLRGARDAIRRLCLESGWGEPVEVQVRGGVYPMPEPLRLGPGDSGTAQSPVTYRAFPGERPVLSGGRPITGGGPTGMASCRRRCPRRGRGSGTSGSSSTRAAA